MCMFSGHVDHVGKTKIYVGDLGNRKRFQVYEMDVNSSEDVAMVLPVPSKNNVTVNFVDLKGYTDFFKDMEKMFENQSFGMKMGKARGLSKSLTLPVEKVGNYIASFVPTVDDFDRLDEKFRLPQDVVDSLPYEDFSFAVFQLKKGKNSFHPMAFTYECVNDKIFIPTLHLHDGDSIKSFDDYDHSLYIGAKTGIAGWEGSSFPASSKMKMDKLEGLVDNGMKVSKFTLHGSHKNGDMIIDENTPDHNFIGKQKDAFYSHETEFVIDGKRFFSKNIPRNILIMADRVCNLDKQVIIKNRHGAQNQPLSDSKTQELRDTTKVYHFIRFEKADAKIMLESVYQYIKQSHDNFTDIQIYGESMQMTEEVIERVEEDWNDEVKYIY